MSLLGEVRTTATQDTASPVDAIACGVSMMEHFHKDQAEILSRNIGHIHEFHRCLHLGLILLAWADQSVLQDANNQ